MYGWTGKILRVNLTNQTVTKEDDTDYQEKFIGGMGFESKIFWEEVPPTTKAYDPGNKLIFMCGPATGSASPASGRVELAGITAQGYPHEHYSKSGAGGKWGPELKFAGYDGLIVEGKADKPVYLWINDDKVEFRDAEHLWGQGIFNTDRMIRYELGNSVSIAAIGQAGENLVRIATIQTDWGSSFGQGGYGAVMGSKNLKAIAVKGSGSVAMAKPDELLDLWRGLQNKFGSDYNVKPEDVAQRRRKLLTCGANCPKACVTAYPSIPSVQGGFIEGWEHCAGYWMVTPNTLEAQSITRAAGNDWGLNTWECVYGLVQWVQYCCNAGYLSDVGGVVPSIVPTDARAHPSQDPVVCCPSNSHESFIAIMKAITFREGDIGNALAEGLGRACDILGFGQEFRQIITYKDGYPDHCASRWKHNHHFPFWVWTALSYGVDYRDTSDFYGHSLIHLDGYPAEYKEGGLSWDEMNAAMKEICGADPCVAPETGYDNKAKWCFFHNRDGRFWNSVILCDSNMSSMNFGIEEKGVVKIETPAGKTYSGPDLDWIIYNMVTGKSIDGEERLKIGERIWVSDRAIMVREGRVRKGGWYTNADESVIPYFVKWGDTYDGIHGDADELVRVFSEYYQEAGWDVATGWPTRAKYEELGLKNVADELGAMGKLP